jgi:phage terminase large subunit-like protein
VCIADLRDGIRWADEISRPPSRGLRTAPHPVDQPAEWGEAAVRCHDDFDADDAVVEVNFGGDMATEVVKQAAERVHQRGERESNLIRIKEVTASRGKAMRAEPISLLFERGRVLMRRGLDQLEGEMMAFSREWDRSVDGSPNRLDAMIRGLTRLSKIITHISIA